MAHRAVEGLARGPRGAFSGGRRLTDTATKHAGRRTRPQPGVFARYRPLIGEALRRELARDDVGVFNMLRFHMGWEDAGGKPWAGTEGKALRPTLCLFACEAAGGPPTRALAAATALELIHNFSLIHDDIQDRDETRHQRATLWAQWGIPRALVAGNTMRVIADRAVGRLLDEDVSVFLALSVTRLLTEAYLEMIEGQYLDLVYEGRPDIGLPEYLDMIARKTGALIRCSMTLGALLGAADEAEVEAFRECGRALGCLFQIRDDVLGVWGEEQETGKPVGADIRRKKNSFPVVYAMSKAAGEDRRMLKHIYGKPEIADDDVELVLDVMDRCQTRERAQSLTAEHRDVALEAASGARMSPQARRDLEELAEFLLVREH